MNPADANYNWGSSRKRYEWQHGFQMGMAPRDPELEKDLFGEENHVHSGINFSKYDSIKVKVRGDNPPPAFDHVSFSFFFSLFYLSFHF